MGNPTQTANVIIWLCNLRNIKIKRYLIVKKPLNRHCMTNDTCIYIFLNQAYDVGNLKNRLNETVLLSTQTKCFKVMGKKVFTSMFTLTYVQMYMHIFKEKTRFILWFIFVVSVALCNLSVTPNINCIVSTWPNKRFLSHGMLPLLGHDDVALFEWRRQWHWINTEINQSTESTDGDGCI